MAIQGVAKGTATSGTIHKVATYQVNESSEDRQIQRVTLNDSSGTELLQTTATGVDPVDVTLTSANTNYVLIETGAKIGWIIDNQSDTDVYIGFTSNLGAASKTGIRLYAGASYEMRGAGVYTGNIYGRCASAGKIVMVQTW